MGGINHQPTKTVSLQLTVPASRALSRIGVHVLAGNVAIEDVIDTAQTLSYAAGRGHLEAAVADFEAAKAQTNVFNGYVRQICSVLAAGDYEPFVPATTIELDDFFAQLVANGLVSDGPAARAQVEAIRSGSYLAAFESYHAQADRLYEQLALLSRLTADMRDGVAGFQGLFWEQVESNTVPWRQAFALALARWQNLLAAFQTGALISTETYLTGMRRPGLMTNLRTVTLVTADLATT